MARQIRSIFAAIAVFAFVASCKAQDYDGETETQITGLSGLSGLGGLSALANGVVAGYAPSGGNQEVGNGQEAVIQNAQGEIRNLGAQESSDVESGDYDEDSNDSSASEEHPILSKFFNLINGVRHRRSVDQADAPMYAAESHERFRRHAKGYVPYVSTYVKTDKKANFKWGVKAKVGKKYGK